MQIKIEQLYCSDKFYGGVDDALRAASQEQKANLLRKHAGDISRLHHWLTREMRSEERPQEFHTDQVAMKN